MSDAKPLEAQVSIVGAGPVGILLAILLGQRGHQVVLVDRWLSIYDRPRAVTMDAEVARILATFGIDCDTDPAFENHKELYYWKNAKLEDLQIVDWESLAPSGWHVTYWFNQPELETRLMSIAQSLETVNVLRGWQAINLENGPDMVTLDLRQTPEVLGAAGETRSVRSQYVVGADGANSFVRDALGMPMIDKGYFFDWLILDMIPDAGYEMSPAQWQLCDPRRPTTLVPGGPGRRRWEFMVLPNENVLEIAKPEVAWQLLEPWGLNPQNAKLERSAVYKFQARWAEKWRSGRCMIAGDAAHLMPPFAGEGMCAGLRDAVALGWRLGAVLDGTLADAVLDSYESERKPHAKHYIEFSQQLGDIICIVDPEKAAERDRIMMEDLAARNHQAITGDHVKLGSGIWCEATAGAGEISAQGIVEYQGQTDRFDQAVGQGWFILALNANGHDLLTEPQFEVFTHLGGRILSIGAVGAGCDVLDIEGFYAGWMAELVAKYIIIRPDFYVAASAETAAELSACFNQLMLSLPFTALDPTPRRKSL